MGQTTILIMILTIVSKIFGFVRESVMAAYIGAGELKSIYTTSMTIPNMMIAIITAGIITAYIPTYNKVRNDISDEAAKDFTSNLINILMFYGFLALLIVFIFARPLSKLFSPDLSGTSLDLCVNFTRIIVFTTFTLLYASVTKGYLNIKGNFVDPALVGIILNIVIIIFTILTNKFNNPYILIFGALFANVIQFIRFPYASKKLGFKYKRIFNLKDIYIKYLMTMMLPIIFSSAADQLSILVDNSMASAFFGVSSVSKIYYAKTMLNFIMGVVTVTVATVSFPEIARLGQAGEIEEMKSSISSAIIMTMLLVIPATLGMMALSSPIIKLAFERNAFTSSDTSIVASLLVSYGPFIIFTSFIKILGNAFYSVGDAKTPVIIIFSQQGINIILNFILVNFIGINGIALATSVSTAIGTLLMIIAFKNKFGSFNFKGNLKSVAIISICSFIMSIIALIVHDYLKIKVGLILSLLISVSLSGIVYLLSISLSNIDEVKSLKLSFKERINKKGE